MRTVLYQRLLELHHRHGPREFGKLFQKFVALAYHAAGYQHVVERTVQGVDVDVASGPWEKHSLEVKTTLTDSVEVKPKDLEGLASRGKDGYLPLLGVLRLEPLSDWWLVSAGNLKSGRLYIERLRPYRRRDLEASMNPLLYTVVENHFDGALCGAQVYLNRILRQADIKIIH